MKLKIVRPIVPLESIAKYVKLVVSRGFENKDGDLCEAFIFVIESENEYPAAGRYKGWLRKCAAEITLGISADLDRLCAARAYVKGHFRKLV